MTDRDWDFAIGGLGDPLADIEPWMLPPYPDWVLSTEDTYEYLRESEDNNE